MYPLVAIGYFGGLQEPWLSVTVGALLLAGLPATCFKFQMDFILGCLGFGAIGGVATWLIIMAYDAWLGKNHDASEKAKDYARTKVVVVGAMVTAAIFAWYRLK